MCLGYQIAIKQGNSSSFCDICYTYRTHKVVMSCGHHNNVCECVGISEVACFLCNKMETLNEWIVDVYNRVRPSRLPCITTLGASQLDVSVHSLSINQYKWLYCCLLTYRRIKYNFNSLYYLKYAFVYLIHTYNYVYIILVMYKIYQIIIVVANVRTLLLL